MSHSSSSCRLKRLRLVGQHGFFDSGNVDIVAEEECQHISDRTADSVRVPLRLSSTVSESWCRVRSWVHFDIAGKLKQKVGAAELASAAPPPKRRLDE